MATEQIIERAMEEGQGIVRLAPNWVPRVFCVPGRRIKLHPDDYYALGGSVVASMSAGLPPPHPPITDHSPDATRG